MTTADNNAVDATPDDGVSRELEVPLEAHQRPDQTEERMRLTPRAASTLKRTGILEQSPEEEARVASVKLATAKLITILWKREGRVVEVERSSAYGSCLVLPQVARSAGWPRELLFLTIRSYIMLFLAIGLQTSLVYYMAKEEVVVQRFAEQNYLCDMGRNIKDCPDGPGCWGPGGTKYAHDRLYGWTAFATRNYVKACLLALFPGMHDEIEEQVDPGEFGVESHLCRLIGCFLFGTSLTSEFFAIFNMFWMLIKLPSKSDSWISYEQPLEGYENDKAQAKAVRGVQELDCVKIKLSGMPLLWKVINGVTLLLPKVVVFLVTLFTGTSFLMETAGIDDGIVNSTALVFILTIDEMIYETLTNNFTRTVMDIAEAFMEGDDTAVDEKYDHAEALEAFERTRIRTPLAFLTGVFPVRVFVSIGLTTIALCVYYQKNCQLSKDGIWVSKPQYLPLDKEFSVAEAFLPMLFRPPYQPEPYWQYPSPD